MSDGEVHIRFVDVAKRFGAKVVYDGLDLEVRRGETLALLGRSGAGKSVMLRMLLGLLRPDRGEIWVDGEEITRLPEARLAELRRKAGMVFQGSALFDSLTVAENVAYALVERRWPAARVEARVAECLELVHLGGTEALLPAALSGGMRKRVAIARAIAASPELMLYDEPTTGLDPATARRVNQLIRDLQARLGVTSIVVTHDMATVFACADRLAIVDQARVAWVGDARLAERDAPEAMVRFLGEVQEQEEGESPWTPTAGSP